VVGQVSNRSPLATTTANNRPRLTLVPSVRSAYDSNALPIASLGDEPRDNMRVTPGIDLDYRRLFGRVALSARGSAGYDFNSRFRFLNQSRINISGSAQAPVGSICSAIAEARYERSRFDLNDTQASAGATSTTQTYSANANCTRGGGVSPVAGFTYRSLESSQARFFDYQQYVETLGIAYTKPSIGTITLNAMAAQLRRPFLAELTGFNDDTDVYSLAIGLNRSVSPRIRIRAAGGMTKADPRRAGVPSFLGASYDGQVEWLPVPRLTFIGSALREVTNQGGVSSTYVIRENYALSARLQASAKSQISVTGSSVQRDFRGEDLTPSLLPIRTDQSNTVSANYSYDLSRRLRVNFGVSRRRRKADNPIYNFKSTVLSSSIGAHF
jgi:hypothetical protein